jgi:hypothetical protein
MKKLKLLSAPLEINNLILKGLLTAICLYLTIPSFSQCSTLNVTVVMPSVTFDICDFTFTSELTVLHHYPASHTYLVSFVTYNGFFGYIEDGTLSNVTYTPTGPGRTLVTGLLLSVKDPAEEITVTMHTLTFSRDASFTIAKNFTIDVDDTSCSPANVANENLIFLLRCL